MLVFIHVAKTGGRSVETLLGGSFGAAYAHAEPWRRRDPAGASGQPFVVPKYGAADLTRLRRLCPWARCVGGHAVALWSGLEVLGDVRAFAFVRDPIARAASHFQFQARTSPAPRDWEDWLAWPVPHDHQLKMFSREGNVDEALAAIERRRVFIGLTERFDESLVMLRRLLAPELTLAYERRNTARDNDVADAILADPERRAALAERNREEIRFLRRLVDEVYARQEAACGDGLAAEAAALAADPAARLDRGRLAAARRLQRWWLGPWGRLARRRDA